MTQKTQQTRFKTKTNAAKHENPANDSNKNSTQDSTQAKPRNQPNNSDKIQAKNKRKRSSSADSKTQPNKTNPATNTDKKTLKGLDPEQRKVLRQNETKKNNST